MTDRTSALTDEEVRSAFRRWSRTVFAAPRHPEDLIVRIERRDEVIERRAIRVRRRDLVEMTALTAERSGTTSPVDASTVDPFAFTDEALQSASLRVTPCEDCDASGVMPCDECSGDGEVRCPTCRGIGDHCRACKETGRVPCWPCNETGELQCRTCLGSGHYSTWLTLRESEHWEVALLPSDSPAAALHPALGEHRRLERGELSAFEILDEEVSSGESRQHHQLPSAPPAFDRRLERIEETQYLRLAVARRDVVYAMCGAIGRVTLSGTTLAGERTPGAVRPIKRRLVIWPALVAPVALVAVLLRWQLVGSSRYFESAQSWSLWTALGAVACAVPAAGTILRLWLGGLRFHRPSRALLAFGGVVLSLGCIAAIGLFSRPSQADVRGALAAGNVVHARTILEGLKEFSESGRRDVLELEDQVMLAEAATEQGQARIALLDAVAARRGTAAAEAAASARRERMSQIGRLVQAKDSAGALAAIDKWFPRDTSVEVAEERARAHELRDAACVNDPCRLAASVAANGARTTPDREARVSAMRAKIVGALSVERVTEKPVLPRLQQAQELHAFATSTLKIVKTDEEVRTRAQAAIAFVERERAKVPLLGMSLEVANELLGPNKTNELGIPMFYLDGATVFLAMSKSGTCRGVYAIGSLLARRAFNSSKWHAERILSQVLGRPVVIKVPPSGATISKWSVGGVPIVARWRLGRVVELRIGDAQP